jgi:hypothetical protein
MPKFAPQSIALTRKKPCATARAVKGRERK